MTANYISDCPVDLPFAELRDRIAGSLLLPTDLAYPQYATPWNVAVPTAPAAVVRVADADDVATTVRFADRAGFAVDVRATGHGAAATDAGIVLVHTGDLDELVIHPEGWARAGAGVRWQRVIDAAAPHGLAPLCGSAPGVGVVGFLTGGGLGPLARTFGVGSDHVRAFDVVTGDGRLRRATPTENPALFWGLCGGKGALGIVTAVEFDLVRLPSIFGGCLYFDGADAAAVVHAWSGWVATLPEPGTSSLAILQLPPLPAVPPPLAGRLTIAVRFAWTGDPETGADVLAPMLDVAPIVLGGAGVMPYREIGSIHADPTDPMPTTESADLLDALTPEAVDALLAVAGPGSGSPQVIVELRHLGGAVARTPERGDPLSHRGAAFALLTIGIGVPPLVEDTRAHAHRVAAAMSPWTTGGTLPNFGGAATTESVRRSYEPGTLHRLASLAEAYDPHGVLACGRAIRCAVMGADHPGQV